MRGHGHLRRAQHRHRLGPLWNAGPSAAEPRLRNGHRFEDEMTQRYQISALQKAEFDDFHNKENLIFNIGYFNNRVINSVKANNYSQISSLTRVDEVIRHNTKTKVISKSTRTKMSRLLLLINHYHKIQLLLATKTWLCLMSSNLQNSKRYKP